MKIQLQKSRVRFSGKRNHHKTANESLSPELEFEAETSKNAAQQKSQKEDTCKKQSKKRRNEILKSVVFKIIILTD